MLIIGNISPICGGIFLYFSDLLGYVAIIKQDRYNCGKVQEKGMDGNGAGIHG